jgi:glycosyltransferase involved in cell wall biosynthesis
MTVDDIDLSVIVPLYQEEKTLDRFLERLYPVLRGLSLRFEVVVIDDGSRDATWDRVCSLGGALEGLRGLRLSRNFGKEAAVCAGLESAQGRLLLVMDGDLEHPPELIPSFLEARQRLGVQIVEGIKEPALQKKSLPRKLANRLYFQLFRWATGLDIAEQTDYKLFDRQVREAWLRLGERAVFFRGMMAWLGFTRHQVRFTVPTIPGRTSRWSTLRLIRLATESVTSYSALPLQLVALIGFCFGVVATVLGLQTLWRWFNGTATVGFPTIILLQLVTTSLILLSLGLIGTYLAKIYDEVKARPRYLVAQTTSPSKAGP